MGKYPNHHGYAVNVKDYGAASYKAAEAARAAGLSEEEIEAVYEGVRYDFWEYSVQELVREFEFTRAFYTRNGYRTRFEAAYSAGRMGGWCKPHPQPLTDDMYPSEIDAFEAEFAQLAALIEAEARYFADELVGERMAEAIAEKEHEAHERAHWAARDVETR